MLKGGDAEVVVNEKFEGRGGGLLTREDDPEGGWWEYFGQSMNRNGMRGSGDTEVVDAKEVRRGMIVGK